MADFDPSLGVPFEERRDAAPDGTGPTLLTGRKASEEVPYAEGEMQVVDWVYSLFDEAEKGKEAVCSPDRWPQDLAAYWGDSWPDKTPTYKPRISVNEIKSLMLQELSDLTDTRLKIYVQKNAFDRSRDQVVEDYMQTFWVRKFCDMVMLECALDGLIFPLGFWQRGWDMNADPGQGEVVFKSRDPRTVYPDPDGTSDEDLRYNILEDVMDLVQIREDWPETGHRVLPEANFSDRIEKHRELGSGTQFFTPLYNKMGMSGVPGYKKARARLLTVTVKDNEKLEEIQSINGALQQVTRLRYPNQHMIQVANNRVLFDEDNPYHFAPMIGRVMLQPAVHSYWPQASVTNEYTEIQNTANKSDSLVAENMLRLNMGLVFADADCGIKPGWSPIPGLFTLKKPGSQIQFQNGVPMPPEMINAGRNFRSMIRENMGYPLSRTGAGTHGNVAAELAETEISQAMGLTRLRGRLLYMSV